MELRARIFWVICVFVFTSTFMSQSKAESRMQETQNMSSIANPDDNDYLHLSDFSEGKATGWRLATDRVMGGLSDGNARLVMEDVGKIAHMTGVVSTANNGGFIQVRKRFESGTASEYEGVFLQVRGNSEAYAIHLRNGHSARPWMNYRQSFSVTGNWQMLYLPFSDFKPSRSAFMPASLDIDSIYSLGIVAYGGDFEADLQIAQVGFYKNAL